MSSKYLAAIDRLLYFNETAGGYATIYDPANLATRVSRVGHDPSHSAMFRIPFNDATYDTVRNRLYLSAFVTDGGGPGRVYWTDESLASDVDDVSDFISLEEVWSIEYIAPLDRVAVAHTTGSGAVLSFIDPGTDDVDLSMQRLIYTSVPGSVARALQYRADTNRIYISLWTASGNKVAVFRASDISLEYVAPTSGTQSIPNRMAFDPDGDGRVFLLHGRHLSILV